MGCVALASMYSFLLISTNNGEEERLAVLLHVLVYRNKEKKKKKTVTAITVMGGCWDRFPLFPFLRCRYILKRALAVVR